MEIVLADVNDAGAILDLQKLCYRTEAALCDDDTLPPLLQSLESMQGEFGSKIVLKAVESGRIIGSVRAYMKDETCCVERLIVHPDFQNKGVGKKLMGSVESIFLSARRFELFTGEKSLKNIALYRSIGYRELRKEQMTPRVTLLYMEKVVF